MVQQVCQRQFQRAALARCHLERGHGYHRLEPIRAHRQALQFSIEFGDLRGSHPLHQRMARRHVAQAFQQGLQLVHLRLQPVDVLRGLFSRRQDQHLSRPVTQRAEPDIQAQARGMPHRHRDHMRGDALGDAQLGRTSEFLDALLTHILAVQQHHRIDATCLAVGAQQGVELAPLFMGLGVGVGQGTRGAHRGAGPAPHAQMGIDLNLLAGLV